MDDHSYNEYFESVGELQRREYDSDLTNAEEELQNVLFLRDGSVNMQDMVSNYELEDEALLKINVSLAKLYNYLLQPFLDMREISFSKLQTARRGLANPNLGDRPKREFAKMFSEWQTNYIHALDSIQQLYMKYYSKTVKLQQGGLNFVLY